MTFLLLLLCMIFLQDKVVLPVLIVFLSLSTSSIKIGGLENVNCVCLWIFILKIQTSKKLWQKYVKYWHFSMFKKAFKLMWMNKSSFSLECFILSSNIINFTCQICLNDFKKISFFIHFIIFLNKVLQTIFDYPDKKYFIKHQLKH